MKNSLQKILSIGLLAFGLSVIPQDAHAAAAELQQQTNAVTDNKYTYFRDYGAGFNIMVPAGPRGQQIDVESGYHFPTNVAGSRITFFSGNLGPTTVITNAGASGDNFLNVTSTNGLFSGEKVVLQIGTETCLLLSVSNILAGSNYIAFNETLGVTVPVGSQLFPMNGSNVLTANATNIWNLPPNPFAARPGWPLLISVTDGGKFGAGTRHRAP